MKLLFAFCPADINLDNFKESFNQLVDRESHSEGFGILRSSMILFNLLVTINSFLILAGMTNAAPLLHFLTILILYLHILWIERF